VRLVGIGSRQSQALDHPKEPEQSHLLLQFVAQFSMLPRKVFYPVKHLYVAGWEQVACIAGTHLFCDSSITGLVQNVLFYGFLNHNCRVYPVRNQEAPRS